MARVILGSLRQFQYQAHLDTRESRQYSLKKGCEGYAVQVNDRCPYG